MRHYTTLSRRGLLRCAGISMLAAEPAAQSISSLLEGDGLVLIPAGEFLMGWEQGYNDEKPAHRVRISRAFEMGKYEVTQGQWKTVMSEAHRTAKKQTGAAAAEMNPTPSRSSGASLPVDSVSWPEVQLFLARLSARSAAHRFRLPTEAEWEYAAVAGKSGTERGTLGERAWYRENSGDEPHPVGEKQPNGFGLYDMDGNVAEWVNDWYAFDYYEDSPAEDPQGPETGSYRVFRGGCWSDEERACRATARRFDFPANRFHNVGFRVVRVAK